MTKEEFEDVDFYRKKIYDTIYNDNKDLNR